MAEPATVPSTSPDAPVAKPGDGKGPDRLRLGLEASRKRGPYKCRRCGVKHTEGGSCGSPSVAEPKAAPPVPLFTPENTARLLRAPFTIAAVRTNCRIWLLEPGEEAELCASAVPMLNDWVAVDPKWVSLFMFSFSLSSIALSKALSFGAWTRAMEVEAAAEREKSKRSPEQVPTAPVGVPSATAAPPSASIS